MLKGISLRSASLMFGFWAIVFLLNVGPNWHSYSSLREVIDVGGTITILQALVAVMALAYLVPRWLDRGRVWRFATLLLGVLFAAALLNVLICYFYLEPTYPDTYGSNYQTMKGLNLTERLGYPPMIRYIIFSKLPLFFFPAAVLVAVNYYRRQQQVLAVKEKRRAAELDALKNQLNPHFLFNTLNNIYALALKSSDRTPDAVAKLAGILDYVLYRCNGEFVSLGDEIEMIKDYITLERLRFGERLEVSFVNQAEDSVKIAPLLILTLIENAFKHGASQELNKATIHLCLNADESEITFEVSNSKPGSEAPEEKPKSRIGLANLRRQLDLIYPNAHRLAIDESPRRYTARLTLAHVAS
ncbi:MAG: sensor histidine kinase [Pseudomonadota bacterium]